MIRLFIVSFISVLLSISYAQAQKLTYDDHILPLLENSCTNCHNPDKQKGGLDLTSYRGLLAGGSGGKVVTAGDGAGSKMFTTSAHLAEPLMPPEGERLGKKELNTLRAWIDGGLLETKNSVAKKDNTPKIDFSQLDTNKPSGPPPMPVKLDTDPVMILQRSGAISAMVSSPWAPLVAIASEKQVLLYNTDNFDLEGILPFTKGNPESLSFHPSGKYLLAGGGLQGKSGTTTTWDVTTGKAIMTTAKEYDSIIASSLRPDLQAITTSGPSRLVKMWQTKDNSLLHSIKKHTDWVTNVSYSPDGVLLASADRNGGIMVWEALSGNEFHTLRGHTASVTALKWSTNSNFLASASEDGTYRIWSISSGKEIKKVEAHKAGILSLDWARAGQIITAGRDNTIKIWKPDYKLLKEIKYPGELPNKVCWSHDAKRFISSDYRGEIIVWDSKTHQQIGHLISNPVNLTDRIALTQTALTKQKNILAKKLSQLQAATKHKQDQEAKIQTNHKQRQGAEQQIKKLKTANQNEQKAINSLNQQQKKVAQQLKQPQAKEQQIAKQLKQTHQKLAQLDKQLTGENNEVNKLQILLNKHRTELQHTQEKIKQEPDNKAHKAKLQQLTKTIQTDLKKLEQRKSKVSKTLAAKEAQHQLSLKQSAEHKQLQNHLTDLRKQHEKLSDDLKKCHTQSKNHLHNIKTQNNIAKRQTQLLPKLKNGLKPLIEAEKKAKANYEQFIPSVTAIEEKLARLQARKK